MTRHEREACRLHARLRGFRAKVARAQATTAELLGRANTPYVAFSGGKDSTVCLSLARAQKPDIPAIMSHDQWLLPETDEFIHRVPQLTVIAGPHVHAGGVRTWHNTRPNDPLITWIDCHSYPLERYVARQGYDGAIIGLRAAEAGYRARHISAKGTCFQRVNGVTQAYPIAGWSDMDVWAYLLSTGTPYNTAYDRMSELGIPMSERRVGPWWNDRAISGGSIEKLRLGWPGIFKRFQIESQQ